ncbi:hypothetical protein ACFVFH_16360 [Streptomyces sp. NPDC057697]|uniref:hypothetical protein n=1 Tax=Streptomyces sp. NPDC057697 TaxID=3346219 RepID=UPI003689F4DE
MIRRVGTAAAVVGVLSVSVAGCGGRTLAVPEEFCERPIERDALEPLLPEGRVAEAEESASGSHLSCRVKVDKAVVLTDEIAFEVKPLPPESWVSAPRRYQHGQRRGLAVPGAAVVGDDGAVVEINCKNAYPAKYIHFDVKLWETKGQPSSASQGDVLNFLDDHVPAMIERLRCAAG